MLNVLVTGGTGFVGSWLVERAPEGVECTAIGRAFDLDGDYDLIVHSALAQDPDLDVILAERVVKTGIPYVFVSSGAARWPGQYGATKRLIECIMRDGCILRLYSFIGPRLNRFAPYEMMREALDTGEITIYGSGEVIRTYLHAFEMADLMWSLILDNPAGVFEVGSSVPVRMLDLAQEIAEQTGATTINVLGGPDSLRDYYVPIQGIVPTIGLSEAVSLTLRGMT